MTEENWAAHGGVQAVSPPDRAVDQLTNHHDIVRLLPCEES